MTDKQKFLKDCTILCDCAEKKNQHIISALDRFNVAHEDVKLQYGDYSFRWQGKDFSLLCAIERKANVDELYQNIMSDRNRLECEFYRAKQMSSDFALLVESVASWSELEAYKVPDKAMQDQHRKIADIGRYVDNTLQAWRLGNRYNFDVEFVKDKNNTASIMLKRFFYFWHNYKTLTANRRKE